METIRIKYLKDVAKIQNIANGDWIDLRAAENVRLTAGESTIIPLGIAMQLPEGYEALVLPRSSSFRKYGFLVANSMGVIDNSYCGDRDEWGLVVYATRDEIIEKDERICQFRIIKNQPDIIFEEVDNLGNDSRGGFGSTGRK